MQVILPQQAKLSNLTLQEQGILYSMLNEGANNIPLRKFKNFFSDTTSEIKDYLSSLQKKGFVKCENGIYSLLPDIENNEYFYAKNIDAIKVMEYGKI